MQRALISCLLHVSSIVTVAQLLRKLFTALSPLFHLRKFLRYFANASDDIAVYVIYRRYRIICSYIFLIQPCNESNRLFKLKIKSSQLSNPSFSSILRTLTSGSSANEDFVSLWRASCRSFLKLFCIFKADVLDLHLIEIVCCACGVWERN